MLLLDLISDPYPGGPSRGAHRARRARIPERFVSVLSGLETDKHWTVRAALATALAELPAETAAPLLEPLVARRRSARASRRCLARSRS